MFEIKHLLIENGVTSIGDYAFEDCTALTEVNFIGSEEQWNNMTIGQDALPQGVTVNYNYGAAPEEPQPDPNMCHWCGKVHEGFFQGIIGFFHAFSPACSARGINRMHTPCCVS